MDNAKNISQRTGRNIFTLDFILGFFAYFFFLAAINSLTPTFPIYLTRLGSDEREVGVLIGVLAVASLASRLFVGGALLKWQVKSVMMIGAFGSVITFLAYIVFHPLLASFHGEAVAGRRMGLHRYGSHCICHECDPAGIPGTGAGLFHAGAQSCYGCGRSFRHVSYKSVGLYHSFSFLRGSCLLHLRLVFEA